MDDSSILSGPVGQRGKGSHIPRGDARRSTPGAGDLEDGGAAGGPLGIYAKNYSTQEVINPLTGEITRFKIDPKSREYVEEIDPSRFRWERFAHKSVVNQLLPTSRTSKCMRWRVPNQSLQMFKSQ